MLALAICGAVLVLPLALSVPGGAPEAGDDVVLAAGAPEGAGTGAIGEAVDDADQAAEEQAADDEAWIDEGTDSSDPAITQPSANSRRRKAAAAAGTRSPTSAKAKAKTATATTTRSTATTEATVAKVAVAAAPPSSPPPPPPPPSPPPPPPAASSGDAVWDKLAHCESSNTNDPGAPYYGYWQFSEATWHGLGEAGLPNEHSRERQLTAAKRLHAARGWAPWPDCARRLGLG